MDFGSIFRPSRESSFSSSPYLSYTPHGSSWSKTAPTVQLRPTQVRSFGIRVENHSRCLCVQCSSAFQRPRGLGLSWSLLYALLYARGLGSWPFKDRPDLFAMDCTLVYTPVTIEVDRGYKSVTSRLISSATLRSETARTCLIPSVFPEKARLTGSTICTCSVVFPKWFGALHVNRLLTPKTYRS